MSRPERESEQRATILAAAIRILHDHGAGALTVRAVAKGAGCSTTGVYTWFGGKNGLVEAIFLDGFERFGHTLLDARASVTTGSAITTMATAYRQWALDNPTHYQVMFEHSVPDFVPELDAMLRARATFLHLVSATQATIDMIGHDGDATRIAHHIWAGMHGYVSIELANMDMIRNVEEKQRRYQEGVRWLILGTLGERAL